MYRRSLTDSSEFLQYLRDRRLTDNPYKLQVRSPLKSYSLKIYVFS